MNTTPIRLIGLFLLPFMLSQLTACKNAETTTSWKPQAGPLMTQWATDVQPGKTWTAYPRPQMERSNWVNMNGLWDYAITDTAAGIPSAWTGKILVPYPIESALSGVMKRVSAKDKIWYQRTLNISSKLKSKRVLLNFEAVDWESHVFIDGQEVGAHRGGYDPFTIDITSFVKPGVDHRLTVSVWDPSTEGYQPVGKQFSQPKGIWYTPSSGIWQTVWLEKVPNTYISDYHITPDIDHQQVQLKFDCSHLQGDEQVQVKIYDKGKLIGSGASRPDETMTIAVAPMHLWAPDDPYLYDLEICLDRHSSKVDQVKGYFGMRKISIGKDEKGVTRILLNNKFVFQNGPLDQGFWPDGLYTPPTEQAMVADLDSLKAMRFNMLRKHVKVEPRRFYYYTDHMGFLVWQDMPSMYYKVPVTADSLPIAQAAHTNFEMELGELIKDHFNSPSIIMWVPFNEGWGQYQTERIVSMVRSMDPSRLVNNASGWTDKGVGDVNDMHNYPEPSAPPVEENRAIVLGEFGGLGYYVDGHVWQKENWGYEKMQSTDALLDKYENFYQQVFRLRDEKGLSACVYTQTTDVETETNGLMTYDRHHVKIGAANIAHAHAGRIAPRLKSGVTTFTQTYLTEFVSMVPGAEIRYTTDGSVPTRHSSLFTEPIAISNSTLFTVKSYWPDGDSSRSAKYDIKKVEPSPAVEVKNSQSGIQVSLYSGKWDKLPDFSTLSPKKTGVVSTIDLAFSKTTESFGLSFKGYLNVPQTGVYQIFLSSDDGSQILIDSKELINYDGTHGIGEKAASIALTQGLHPVCVNYFQGTGGLGLIVAWEGPGVAKQVISSFRH